MPDDVAVKSDHDRFWRESQIKIYLCRSTDDREAAQRLADILRKSSGGRAAVFNASDLQYAGPDLRQQIKERIRQADLLMLLFTDEERDWTEPFFELGLFVGFNDALGQPKPVVCLHPPTVSVPDVLRDRRSVVVIAPPEDVRLGHAGEKMAFTQAQNRDLVAVFVQPLFAGQIVGDKEPIGAFGIEYLTEIAYEISELCAGT